MLEIYMVQFIAPDCLLCFSSSCFRLIFSLQFLIGIPFSGSYLLAVRKQRLLSSCISFQIFQCTQIISFSFSVFSEISILRLSFIVCGIPIRFILCTSCYFPFNFLLFQSAVTFIHFSQFVSAFKKQAESCSPYALCTESVDAKYVHMNVCFLCIFLNSGQMPDFLRI